MHSFCLLFNVQLLKLLIVVRRLPFCTHAMLQGQWLVTDTSTNGTYINGAKIGKNNSAVLRAGDKLGLSVMTPPNATAVNYINTVE